MTRISRREAASCQHGRKGEREQTSSDKVRQPTAGREGQIRRGYRLGGIPYPEGSARCRGAAAAAAAAGGVATVGHAFRDPSTDGPSGNEGARAGASRGPCRTRGGAILPPPPYGDFVRGQGVRT